MKDNTAIPSTVLPMSVDSESDGVGQILQFLLAEGFRPQVNEEGEVALKVGGRHYWISVERRMDYSFVQFYAPNIETLPLDAEERMQTLAKVMHVSRVMRVIKLHINAHQKISADAQGYYVNTSHFTAVFYPLLQALEESVNTFKRNPVLAPQDTLMFDLVAPSSAMPQ